ncbi:MAG: metallophosphoesterase family protein [Nanoarchaeota archaeon]
MIISVFGDVHGNIEGVYKSVRDWQRKNKDKIDLILQVGDLGVYDPNKPPYVKSRVLKKNPNELKIYDFLKNSSIYEKYFNSSKNDFYSSIDAKLFFTRGNHDDASYLKKLEDKNLNSNFHYLNDKILYLSDSKPTIVYADDGEYVTFAGIGGIEKKSRPNSIKKDPSISINENALFDALYLKNLDIFLTHMHPVEAKNNGSENLSTLINLIKPKNYFFGHLNKTPSRFKINNTECFGLKQVEYDSIDNIYDKSMVVLEKKYGSLNII